LGALSLLLLILLGFALLRGARTREAEAAAQNQRNQEAIRRLLNEMVDLADGDLTIEATVTEDITGAIADSVNQAVEEMRGLVATINETSVQVSSSAQETRTTAQRLAEASEHQREQIVNASDIVRKMSTTMDEMATRASHSVSVARESLDIAHEGGERVRRTIEGMDRIRDQIQETSKRIKRLGESSLEIGNIVELIEDIADQTNILALNAAMQAAMAGESGRGFAVVADEVQRLAERATNATKQIEALVKTIQADTNEAVISMEASTSEVVSGAERAEEAGEALKRIEEVSRQIAEEIEQIAASAISQSDDAKSINDTMSVIEEITGQTSEGTEQTAQSIEALARMAEQLRETVARFKLPDDDSSKDG
ncbi:MAG: methyl-accepting chemotaxis protein, partial [Gammaproteobacteria bacterium]